MQDIVQYHWQTFREIHHADTLQAFAEKEEQKHAATFGFSRLPIPTDGRKILVVIDQDHVVRGQTSRLMPSLPSPRGQLVVTKMEVSWNKCSRNCDCPGCKGSQ